MSILKKLGDRVKSTLSRALIKAVNDSDEIQLVKIALTADEVQDDIERIQSFGLSSNPPVDSEAVVVYLGGSRDDGIVLAVDSGANRPKDLISGETIFYSAFDGYVKCRDDDKIELMSDVDNLVRFSELKKTVDDLVTYINSHTHPAPGGATSAPTAPSTVNVDAAKIDEILSP